MKTGYDYDWNPIYKDGLEKFIEKTIPVLNNQRKKHNLKLKVIKLAAAFFKNTF